MLGSMDDDARPESPEGVHDDGVRLGVVRLGELPYVYVPVPLPLPVPLRLLP